MIETAAQIWNAFWSGNILALLGFCFALATGAATLMLGKGMTKSRQQTLDWLGNPDNTAIYGRVIDGVLDRLTLLLLPRNIIDDPPPEGGLWSKVDWHADPRANSRDDAWRQASSPFGWPIYDASLKLAMIYPIIFLIVGWWWTGAAGRLGGFEVLPAPESDLHKHGVFFALVVCFGLFSASVYYRAQGRQGYAAAALGLAVAFAVAVAGAVAAAFAGAVAVAVAAAVAAAVAFAFAVAFAAAVAGAGAVAAAGAVAFAVAAAVAVAVAAAVAFALTAGLHVAARRWPASLCYLAFSGALAGILLVAMGIAPAEEADILIWILFLGLLPVLNASFDFLSFGITRTLIVWGRRQRNLVTVLFGFADLAAAALIYTALGCAIIVTLALANWSAGTTIIDIGATLVDIERHPGDYWWLYATLFTTLLPTLAHFVLSSFCLISIVFPSWKRGVKWLLEQTEHGGWLFLGRMALTGIWFVAIGLPILLILILLHGLIAFAPDIGSIYLWLFAEFAQFIGIAVQPADIWQPEIVDV